MGENNGQRHSKLQCAAERKEKHLSEHCCGTGKFFAGMVLGTAAGTALGMTMAPSHRQLKRAARMAAKRVNQAVDNLADAIDL